MKNKRSYIYILRCKDNTLYTGWTVNIKRRLDQHNKGKGAKYTRSRVPLILEYYELFNSRTDAQKREYEIKQFNRKDKLQLINNKKFSIIS